MAAQQRGDFGGGAPLPVAADLLDHALDGFRTGPSSEPLDSGHQGRGQVACSGRRAGSLRLRAGGFRPGVWQRGGRRGGARRSPTPGFPAPPGFSVGGGVAVLAACFCFRPRPRRVAGRRFRGLLRGRRPGLPRAAGAGRVPPWLTEPESPSAAAASAVCRRRAGGGGSGPRSGSSSCSPMSSTPPATGSIPRPNRSSFRPNREIPAPARATRRGPPPVRFRAPSRSASRRASASPIFASTAPMRAAILRMATRISPARRIPAPIRRRLR